MRHSATPRRVVALLAIVIAGSGIACGAPSGPPTPSSHAPAPPSPAPSSQGPAETGPVAVTLPELVESASEFDGRQVIVSGTYVGTAQGQVLCDLLLESYPPQAAGSMVGLVGPMPSEIVARLDSTVDEPDLTPVTWGYVEVIGTFRAGGDGGSDGILELDQVRIIEA